MTTDSDTSASPRQYDNLLARLADAWACRPTDFTRLPASNGDHLRASLVANGRRWYVRGCPPHLEPHGWTFHAHLLAGATPAPANDTLPVPEITVGAPGVLPTRTGAPVTWIDGAPYVALSWLPGETNPRLAALDLPEIAAALGRLNRWLAGRPKAFLPHRTLASTNDMPARLANLAALPTWADEFRPRLIPALRDLPGIVPDRLVPVHGDVHPFNLLCDDARRVTGFCDWDDSHLNAPTFDLAYLLTHTVFIDWPRYLRDQCGVGVRCLPPEDFDLRLAIGLVRRWRDAFGEPVPEGGCLRRSLLESYITTVVFTIWLRPGPDIAAALATFDWLITSPTVRDWESLLARPTPA